MELTDQGPRNTVITLRQTCDTAEARDMAEQGSGMLLDGLEGFLAGEGGRTEPAGPTRSEGLATKASG